MLYYILDFLSYLHYNFIYVETFCLKFFHFIESLNMIITYHVMNKYIRDCYRCLYFNLLFFGTCISLKYTGFKAMIKAYEIDLQVISCLTSHQII